ncbi:MAG: hypothetical protein GF364_09850, partial [Candidatus Lokiarchaeota archaeon]|nr:hypothetical protein [Candidatus Lokiarchaeota archaeon]
VYMLYGNEAGLTGTISLQNANASFIGETAGCEAGYDLSGGGDVNNDGYDDFLIASPHNVFAGQAKGKVCLILGREEPYSMDTSLADANASFGLQQSDSESKIAIIKDVNGDNYDDILIGDTDYGEGDIYSAGKVYLIFGNETVPSLDFAVDNANASYLGIHQTDYAGYSVSGVGDVNGDTFGDFIIGSVYNDDGGWAAGQVYLIFGDDSDWGTDINLTNADVTFTAESGGDHAGWSISGVGDVNGDTLNDFVIGAHENSEADSDAGQVYLILGKSKWESEYDLSNTDASFLGESDSDRLGHMVSQAGDINNDGYDDFLITASGYAEQDTSLGKVYVIFGKDSGWSMDTSLKKTKPSFIGQGDQNSRILSAVGAGDVNNDGYDDILIGEYQNSASESNAGYSFLFLGAESREFYDEGLPWWIFLIIGGIAAGLIVAVVLKRSKKEGNKNQAKD